MKPISNQTDSAINKLKQIKAMISPVEKYNAISVDNIPILDDEIPKNGLDQVDLEIPVLADTVWQPDEKLNELAKQSWQDYNRRLKAWSESLPEPMQAISTQFIDTLQAKLEANWHILFAEQDPIAIEKWLQFVRKD